MNVFFTYIHFSNNIDQAYHLLQSKGLLIAEQLAVTSEFNLLSGNYRPIQHLLNNTIDTNAIVHASVYDEGGRVIARAVSSEYDSNNTPDYLYYRQAIVAHSIQMPDVFASDQIYNAESQVIGWLHLNISGLQLDHTKARIRYHSIAVFIAISMNNHNSG